MKDRRRFYFLSFAFVIWSLWVFGGQGSQAVADDNSPRPLPEEDRQTLNEYLGSDVVGEALPTVPLVHGIEDFISVRDGIAWRMKVTAGKGEGTTQSGSERILHRPGDETRIRIDTGDGRNVLFGQVDPNGSLICYASQDNQEGVISRFTPAQPILLAGMAPGETRKFASDVSVSDLSSSDVETHHGRLNIEFTYMGVYRLRVPAGEFDAVLVKARMTGKIGPADVEDTIYRFFAKGHGFVAQVETEDVSAVLIYHEKTRIGKVLVESNIKSSQ
jgi:hypothetical protein